MQKRFKLALIAVAGLAVLASCDKGSDPKYITPEAYLPAYPGSYWDYTDGTRVRATNYELHNYRPSTTSPDYTDECYVPIWDGHYLYKYSIYQSSPLYPLKELLRAKGSSVWIVDENNGQKLKRSEVFVDSLAVGDSLYKSVYCVTEFLENLDNTNHWNLREYYAKNVGLVKVEVNNPNDSADFVVQKELRSYFINK